MTTDQAPRAKIFGGFCLTSGEGGDLTPVGMKERGVLALLLHQPEQRRSRAALQDMLWSHSPPDKGAANLRRALSNIRKSLGPEAWRMQTDRTHVRFSPLVTIAPPSRGNAVLFEDIDVPGTEFERWLSDARLFYCADGASARPANKPAPKIERSPADPVPEVRIVSAMGTDGPEEAFLADQISGALAERLKTLGDLTVNIGEPSLGAAEYDRSDTLVTLRILALNGEWLVHVRIQALPSLRFMAALHARIDGTLTDLIDHPETRGLLNRAVRAIVDQNAPRARTHPFYAIQNAVRRIYSLDKRLLSTAERLLSDAQTGDASGLALAWRSFVRLTEVLEFRASDPAGVTSALEMATEATQLAPQNPVVWALAAQVQIQMAQDLDLGTYCARRSLECLSDDPYALDAMSTALGALGDAEEAHNVAVRGLNSASGLSNEFSWDMQCCLTALGLGRVDDAIKHARAAHLKIPAYRPAVRYLAALHLFNGNGSEAAKYLERLKKLEPGFSPEQIISQDYPLETFRRLGMIENLNLDLVQ